MTAGEWLVILGYVVFAALWTAFCFTHLQHPEIPQYRPEIPSAGDIRRRQMREQIVDSMGRRRIAGPDGKSAEMDFGDAIRELKNGRRVARQGWNGKGMFLVLVPGSIGLKVEEGRPLAKAGIPVGTTFDYLPHIDMWTAQGDFVPWLASQTDMLADDWTVVAA